MNEGKLREEKERGARAQRLLDDPLIEDAFETVKKSIHATFDSIENPTHDDLMRLYMMNKAVDKVKGVLERHVRTGEMAVKTLTNL